MKNARTSHYNGVEVTVFQVEDDTWSVRIGTNVYGGYATRADAVNAIGGFV